MRQIGRPSVVAFPGTEQRLLLLIVRPLTVPSASTAPSSCLKLCAFFRAVFTRVSVISAHFLQTELSFVRGLAVATLMLKETMDVRWMGWEDTLVMELEFGLVRPAPPLKHHLQSR